MTLLLENISLTIGDVLLVKSFTITIEGFYSGACTLWLLPQVLEENHS